MAILIEYVSIRKAERGTGFTGLALCDVANYGPRV